MKNRSKHILLLTLLLSSGAWSQIKLAPLHYMHRIEHAYSYMEDDQKIHSGVLPAIAPNLDIFDKGKGMFYFEKNIEHGYPTGNKKGFHGRLYPIADIGAGLNTAKIPAIT